MMPRWFLVISLFVSATADGSEKKVSVPQYDAAVQKSVAYLKANADKIEERETSLIAYALLKAGEKVSEPIVHSGIEAAVERARAGHGQLGYEHIYLAGTDAMLLADADAGKYLPEIQRIADYVQSAQQQDGSWAGEAGPGDTSMNQYGMLALWSAVRAGAKVAPDAVERAVLWHLKMGNRDGGWGYRPPTRQGSGSGASTHNCTMAGAGSLGIGRRLLFGPQSSESVKTPKRYGVLEKDEPAETAKQPGPAFPGYRPLVSEDAIKSRVTLAQNWVKLHFHREGHRYNQKQYFFYALERAATLQDMGSVEGRNWYLSYGDVLLTLQSPDGSYRKTNTSPRIAACFAVLYFVRSTQQTVGDQYGPGVLTSPVKELSDLFAERSKVSDELQSLDVLLRTMEQDAAGLDELTDPVAEDVVAAVQFGSPEELIGQVDTLKKLLKHSDAVNRRAAYFALGRTGDFSLIADMIQGLRDPNVDVNVEALQALRYISRKPDGFGLTLDPLSGTNAADEGLRVRTVNEWRTKAYRAWMNWYKNVRPYSESGGLDELVASPDGQRRGLR